MTKRLTDNERLALAAERDRLQGEIHYLPLKDPKYKAGRQRIGEISEKLFEDFDLRLGSCRMTVAEYDRCPDNDNFSKGRR